MHLRGRARSDILDCLCVCGSCCGERQYRQQPACRRRPRDHGWRITIVILPVFVDTLSVPVPDDGSFCGWVDALPPPELAAAATEGFRSSAVASACPPVLPLVEP